MHHLISKLLSTSILILTFCCAPSPARAVSDLVITSITRVSDCTTLRWVSHTGEVYAVLWTDSLNPPACWRVAAVNVWSGGTSTTWSEGSCSEMMRRAPSSGGGLASLSEQQKSELLEKARAAQEEGIKFLTAKLEEAMARTAKSKSLSKSSEGGASLLSSPSPPGGGGGTNTNDVVTTARFYRVVRSGVAGFVDGWGPGYGPGSPGLSNIIQVSASPRYAGVHSMALRADGTVTNWGANGFGQCNVPTNLINVVSIAAGGRHSVAAKSDGTVVSWGDNGLGQVTNAPAHLTNVVAVKAGLWHTLALRADGTVAVWGDLFNRSNAVPAGLSNITAIAAGARHCLALRSDGKVFAWGFSYDFMGTYLPTNVPASLSNVIAISAGMEHNEALLNDRTVVVWGHTNNPALATNGLALTNAVGVAAGWHYGTAFFTDTTVQGWGQGDYDLTMDSIVAFSAGAEHVLVVRTNNDAPVIRRHPQNFFAVVGASTNLSVLATSATNLTYQWQRQATNGSWSSLSGKTNTSLAFTNLQDSDDGFYRVFVSTPMRSITSRVAQVETIHAPVIASQSPELDLRRLQYSYEYLSVLVTNHGARFLHYEWFKNGAPAPLFMGSFYGLHFISTNIEGSYKVIVSNPAGRATSQVWQVSVTLHGEAVMWGDSGYGQRNGQSRNETKLVAVAAGNYHTLGLRENGTVLAWGTNSSGQTDVPAGLSNVIAVAGGAAHSTVLLDNGTVRAWGHNQHGQTNVPSAATNVTAIAAGGPQTVALRRDGTLVAWGNTYIPAGVSNVAAIAAGATHALALLSNSTVQAWGLTSPSGLSNIVAVACGHDHALALKKDGTVVGWGDSSYGATNVPAGLSNVMRITAGYQFSLAMKNDGTVVSWGRNQLGQTNVPVGLSNICTIAAGTYHSVALAYNAALEYAVTSAAEDLLLIYNTNSADSIWVKDYYLAHRPQAASANVCGIGHATTSLETVSTNDFPIFIRAPILNWLAANPTKRPKYWILFLDVPSRLHINTNDPYNAPWDRSVSYQLSQMETIRSPIVTHINMDGTNDCRAYIDKLEYFGTNYSRGKIVVSANNGGYGNTNYFFDDTRELFHCCGPSVAAQARGGVFNSGASGLSVTYSNASADSLANHILIGTNVAGYLSWGFHSVLGASYSTNLIHFYGESGWFIIQTVESQNGWRGVESEGHFTQWFSEKAFGGTNFAHTPIGAVTHTDEPFLIYVNDAATYFGLWAQGRRFGECAWRSRLTDRFQAVGDPLVKR